jgi:hypothetical protein
MTTLIAVTLTSLATAILLVLGFLAGWNLRNQVALRSGGADLPVARIPTPEPDEAALWESLNPYGTAVRPKPDDDE